MNRMQIGVLVAFAAIAVLITAATVGQSTAAAASAGRVTTLASSNACHQSDVVLNTAANFKVLGASTVTNTGATLVKGDLGVSPGTAITGFPPGKVTGTIHATDAVASQAQTDLGTAIANAQALSNCATTVTGNLGGMTLGPGLYVSASSLAISSGDLTLNASGHPNAVFIFVMGSTLTLTSGLKVILTGGASPNHIYWIVGSSATLGTTTSLSGSILAHTSITLDTGATVCGTALANTGAVTMDHNKVSG